MQTKATIVTGTSGTGVGQALRNLERELESAGTEKFENYFDEVENQRIETVSTSGAQYEEMKSRFRSGVDNIVDESSLVTGDTDHGDVLISIHLTYLSEWEDSIYSPVDFERIRNEFADVTDQVLILVDDVYDMYKRLLDQGEKYHGTLQQEPKRALKESIKNLSELLNWRAAEVRQSLNLAHTLDAIPYLVSVKHPTWMISRLFKHDRKTLNSKYLSHHISSVREAWNGQGQMDFHQELNEFINRIVGEDKTVLFVPDTVDEYRLGRQNDRYIPELETRWPLPFNRDNMLATDVPNKDVNPLNPRNYEVSQEKISFISGKLSSLLEEIKRQIRFRDHLLVRQAHDGVVSFRPLWNGNVSKGMNTEMKYNHKRRDRSDERRRRNLVVHKQTDLGKWRTERLFNFVENRMRIDDDPPSNIQNIKENWMQDKSKCNKIATGDWNNKKIKEKIVGPNGLDVEDAYYFHNDQGNGDGVFGRSKKSMRERRKSRKDGWEEAFKKLSADDEVDFPYDEQFRYENRYTEVIDELTEEILSRY